MRAAETKEKKWMFIHVMKTAGTSFRRFCQKSHQDIIYPSPTDLHENPRPGWYLDTDDFVSYVNENGDNVKNTKIFFGHYPYSIVQHLDYNFRVATVLREPIARSISMIKHRRRSKPKRYEGMQDIDIIRNSEILDRQLRNYQTKVFGMQYLPSIGVNDPIKSEENLLDRALENIENLDFLGLTERMEDTVKLWKSIEPTFAEDTFPWANKSNLQTEVSDELIEYLHANLELDFKLYHAARQIFDDAVKVPHPGR